MSKLGFKDPLYPQMVTHKETVPKVNKPMITRPQPMDFPEVVPQSHIAGLSQIRSASVLSDPLTAHDENTLSLTKIAKIHRQEPKPSMHMKQEELEVELDGKEDKIEDEAQGTGTKLHVHDWTDI